MTAHRVADHLAESIEVVGLGEDGLAEGAGGVPSLLGFFNQKDDLAQVIGSVRRTRARCRAIVRSRHIISLAEMTEKAKPGVRFVTGL